MEDPGGITIVPRYYHGSRNIVCEIKFSSGSKSCAVQSFFLFFFSCFPSTAIKIEDEINQATTSFIVAQRRNCIAKKINFFLFKLRSTSNSNQNRARNQSSLYLKIFFAGRFKNICSVIRHTTIHGYIYLATRNAIPLPLTTNSSLHPLICTPRESIWPVNGE